MSNLLEINFSFIVLGVRLFKLAETHGYSMGFSYVLGTCGGIMECDDPSVKVHTSELYVQTRARECSRRLEPSREYYCIEEEERAHGLNGV